MLFRVESDAQLKELSRCSTRVRSNVCNEFSSLSLTMHAYEKAVLCILEDLVEHFMQMRSELFFIVSSEKLKFRKWPHEREKEIEL
jgi:hypothetical protein